MTASLELPDTLVKEAMRITHAPTAKVAVITALEFLVRQPKVPTKKLPHYLGLDMSGFQFSREEANAR
jgi:Arc/MetJ family transcription regulator